MAALNMPERERVTDGIYDRFVDEIVTGRLKVGEKLPTMQQIAAGNGIAFRAARAVVERLAREGYVKSCPRIGTVVRNRRHTIWKGRVLFVSFDDDCASYFVARVTDALRRKVVGAGYLLTTVVASRSPQGDVSQLKTALGQSVDFVVLMYASKHLERIVAASGYDYAIVYGEAAASRPNAWTIPFDLTAPVATFVNHCRQAKVKSVTEVRVGGCMWVSAAAELMADGIKVRQLEIESLAYGRYEGIERGAMEVFLGLPKAEFPDLLLFWDDFAAQGALTAFLARGVRVPEDVMVVVQANNGLGPVFPLSLTRFECDGRSVGERIAAFVLGVLARGRIPSVPCISPTYVFGKSFPWIERSPSYS